MSDCNFDEEMDRVLDHLKRVMKEKGFKQVVIQQVLGWKGSYISQILNRTKSLRVRQLLMILAVIDYSPGQFFSEVFKVEEPPKTPLTTDELVENLREHLQSFISSLVELLESDARIRATQATKVKDGVANV